MVSQKGYTAIEALIWTVGTTLACGVVFALHLWVHGKPEPQPQSTATASSSVTTTVPVSLGQPRPPVVLRPRPDPSLRLDQTIELRCDGDCNGALEQFRRAYQECDIVPLGPKVEDGQTVSYFFFLRGE